MPGARAKFWMNAAKVVLAFIAGLVVYSIVDDQLTPHPTICKMMNLNVDLLGPNENDYHFDRTGRWFCVGNPPGNPSPRYKVFDLFAGGKMDHEFKWDWINRTAHAPIENGIRLLRSVYAKLEIIDKDFATGQDRKLNFDLPYPSYCQHMQFADAGRRLVILQHWPLWPWRSLAGMGQLPLDALLLTAPVRHYSTADGMLVSVYDVATSKLIAKALIAPPTPRYLPVQGQNDRWLIVPEAIVGSKSLCWDFTRGGAPLPNEYLQPPVSRGIRVLDLHTGEWKVLRHEPSDMLKEKQAGAFSYVADGDILRASYVKAVPYSGFGASFEMVVKHPSEDAYPQFDLRTGLKTSHTFPVGARLGHPDWQFTCNERSFRWFPFLQKWGQSMGIDLDDRFPLPVYLQVNFLNRDGKVQHYRHSVRETASSRHKYHASADGNAALVLRGHSDGTEIYRWQIPFEVYSPWWSIAAGVLTTVLLLLMFRKRANRIASGTA